MSTLAQARRGRAGFLVLALVLAATFGTAPLLRTLGLADHDEHLQWRLAGVDGLVLTLAVGEGDCVRFDRTELDESSGKVTLAAVGRVDVRRHSCLATKGSVASRSR